MLTFFSFLIGFFSMPTGETDQIKSELIQILKYYDHYAADSFKDDISDLLVLIDEFEKDGNENTLNSIKEKYVIISYAHNHSLNLSYELEQKKDEYFKAWEKVSYLKRRVDNLFIYELKGGSLALDVNTTDKKVRKKPIYIAYTTVYEQYMRKLRGINECDYQSKIDFLIKIDPILVKSELLLLREDTKIIEKELKNIDTPEEYEKVLLSYP